MRIIVGFPFALLYGLITGVRNFLFDIGIFKQYKSSIPTICVGNLSVGGTGKTPHIEYLIRLLESNYKIAVLSRGYKRKTKGYLLASINSTAEEIGDEPCQYVHKFPSILVAVSEKRVLGAQELAKLSNPPQLILLDDAFQHRHILPDCSILLTDYKKPFYNDFILPSGNLRESRCGKKRAQFIVVTKTPNNISPQERQQIIAKIHPKPFQQVFFSHINYDEPFPFTLKAKEINSCNCTEILAFSGIANPAPFFAFLSQKATVKPLQFPDHHSFSEKDMLNIMQQYHSLVTENKAIFTTEKDAMRLHSFMAKINHLPIWVVPIKVSFSDSENNNFDELILNKGASLVKNI